MTLSKAELWQRFQKYYTEWPDLGLALDLSRMNFADDFFPSMEQRLQLAFSAMAELERGAIANPDENRMVGHYWLRNPALAPTPEIRREIEETVLAIKDFAAEVHRGAIHGAHGPFKNLLLIGIGGSALGPQFVSSALGHPTRDKLTVHFLDNTDPDGMDRVLARIGGELGQTLCLVISKSGRTKETRNGMLEADAAYHRAGLEFERHAVAITGKGGELDTRATQRGWLRRFPMWEWVGGRTSETSAVGLLPAALQGIDIQQILHGAQECDAVTRQHNVKANPSAQLALAWLWSGNGKGEKNMVVLPYKDRLDLFSRYLQQLIMESLGKERDIDGKVVNQGISVYGNKGSTDQHAYVQQLIEGPDDFFVTFVQVLQDREGESIWVEPATSSGDYLHGFLLGTQHALEEKGRQSLAISLADMSPYSIGVLVALFERAVGLYASLVNINAYHQPGVEAGKKAAGAVLDLHSKCIALFDAHRGQFMSIPEIATALGSQEFETLFRLCQHLSANPDRGIEKAAGRTPFDAKFRKR